MSIKVKTKTPETVQIHTIKRGMLKLRIIGDTAMYFNSMSSKAMRDLLVGAQRKTAAEKRDQTQSRKRVSGDHVQTKRW